MGRPNNLYTGEVVLQKPDQSALVVWVYYYQHFNHKQTGNNRWEVQVACFCLRMSSRIWLFLSAIFERMLSSWKRAEAKSDSKSYPDKSLFSVIRYNNSISLENWLSFLSSRFIEFLNRLSSFGSISLGFFVMRAFGGVNAFGEMAV